LANGCFGLDVLAQDVLASYCLKIGKFGQYTYLYFYTVAADHLNSDSFHVLFVGMYALHNDQILCFDVAPVFNLSLFLHGLILTVLYII